MRAGATSSEHSRRSHPTQLHASHPCSMLGARRAGCAAGVSASNLADRRPGPHLSAAAMLVAETPVPALAAENVRARLRRRLWVGAPRLGTLVYAVRSSQTPLTRRAACQKEARSAAATVVPTTHAAASRQRPPRAAAREQKRDHPATHNNSRASCRHRRRAAPEHEAARQQLLRYATAQASRRLVPAVRI